MADSTADLAERQRADAEQAAQEHRDKVERDMDADEFVVIAPYVTLKVRDDLGAFLIRGFNEGGRVTRENIDTASLRHHLDAGLVAPVDAPEARFVGPAGTPKPGEPPNVPVTETPVVTLPLDERLRRQAEAAEAADTERPARAGVPRPYASKDEWVAYAVTQRSDDEDEAEARDRARSMTKAELIKQYGGRSPAEQPVPDDDTDDEE